MYSDFYHPSRKHGSSVYNGNGTGNRSDIVEAKIWSRSKVHHTFVGNQAFYRFG
ncbi:lactococcin 972 family bacteriocin [Frondihabitans sp. 762G35]|uniref:lactococcin 972 family bacteriocin n=1 Tax=Frondihabitans sp. 762G35 TaxID=1446794 RepID=UPI000E70665D